MATTESGDGRKTRTITLSTQAPVRIVDEDWPIIAQAEWQGLIVVGSVNRTARIYVRQHADGRVIVYGVAYSQPAETPVARHGEYIDHRPEDGFELWEAIEATSGDLVGGAMTAGAQALAHDCISRLPPEDI